ncbi:MAG: hypothetical protein NC935_08330, partial [Candidatus Omnitrophica bacterium]|nr:hypothetical protein [Candidatus Omnitrophota bacterium]
MKFYDFYSLTILFSLIISFIIGSSVYIKNRKSRVNKSFYLLILVLDFWLLGCLGESIANNKNEALFWDKILYIGVCLYPFAFLNFLFDILEKNKKTKLFVVIFIFSVIYLIFNFTPSLRFLFIQDVKKNLPFRFIATPNYLWFALVILGVLICIYGLYLIFSQLQKHKGKKRIQLFYLFFSYLILTIGGAIYFFLPFKIKIPPIDAIMVVAFSFIMSYAILKHRLLDIEVIIKKTVVFGGMFLFIFSVVVVVAFFISHLIGGGNILSLIVSALVITFSLRPIEIWLISVTDKFLFQKEHNPEELIKEASENLLWKVTEEQVKDFLISFFTEKIRVEKIIIKDPTKIEILSNWHKTNLKPLLLDEIDYLSKKTKKDLNYLKAPFKEEKTSLSLPILLKDTLHWIILLAEKKSGKPYSKEDLTLLEAISRQVSLALQNILHLEELKHTQLELLRQENLKFVSLLVKGLAHEILNPLTPLMHRIEDLEGEVLINLYSVYEKTHD